MYVIGDKVAYPMHGAGIVQGIEEKKILGETRRYYVLRVPYGDMQIMVPIDNCDDIGVRPIIDENTLKDIMEILRDESSQMSSNWNRRNRENLERLKTGDASEVAAVVRNLMRMDKEKRLSTGEKKMLSNAKHILLSEMILVMDISKLEAEKLIDEAVYF